MNVPVKRHWQLWVAALVTILAIAAPIVWRVWTGEQITERGGQSPVPLPFDEYTKYRHDDTIVCLLIAPQSRADATNEKYGLKSDDLKFVRADAECLSSRFEKLGVPQANRLLLLDEEATQAGVFDKIESLAEHLKKGDRLILGFFGHGLTDERGSSQLVFYDGAMSVEKLIGRLGGLPCSHKLLLLDACHSGQTGQPDIVISDETFRSYDGGGFAWIASSDAEQKSWEDARLKHGLFTHYLDRLLANAQDYDQGPDGWLNLEELGNPLQEQVKQAAKRRGKTQVPKFGTVRSVGTMKLIPAPRYWTLNVAGSDLRPKATFHYPADIAEGDSVWVAVKPNQTRGFFPQACVGPKRGGKPEGDVKIQLGENDSHIGETFDVLLLKCDRAGDAALKSLIPGGGVILDERHMQVKAKQTVTRTS